MNGWSTTKIGNLGRIVTGKTPPSASPELFEGATPFITPSDMGDDMRHIATERFVSEQWDPKRRLFLPTNSVCVVCIGATIGKICMTHVPSYTNQQVNSIIVDSGRYDPHFIYYVLRTKAEDLRARAAGAATPIINKSTFSEITVQAPPLETQRRIASILGAYDDLIEVNRRRIKVLEEMARGLFEEWFVRFRFPGHENIPIRDTPDGPLPEGWERRPLREIAVLRSGFAFKSSLFVEDGLFSLVTIKHVNDGQLTPPFQSKINVVPGNMPTHCYIKSGDILLSLTGNVGRTCLTWGENLLLNQRVAKVEWRCPDLRAYTYLWLRQPQTLKVLQNNANGVAQQNLSPIQTMELLTIKPPETITEKFEKTVGPCIDGIINGFISVSNLQMQRDLLLPRLISGQLSVEAGGQVKEAAA